MRFVLSHASHIERMSFRRRVILHVLRDILRPCAVTSEKAGTSLTESPEKRVSGWKGIRTNTPLSPKFIITTGTANTPLSRAIIILDAPHGYKIRRV